MALSIDTMRDLIRTSLFGRRFGIDQDEFLVGQNGIKLVIADLTSASTATAIPASGYVTITGTSLLTSAQTFLLTNPIAGAQVNITNLNANSSVGSPGSTALTMIRPSTAFVIRSSEGSTGTTINLTPGQSIVLVGLSTALYQVFGRGTLAQAVINGTT